MLFHCQPATLCTACCLHGYTVLEQASFPKGTPGLALGTEDQHAEPSACHPLQGHIGLDQAVFPEGTPGLALDTLARVPLWNMGLNYRHGTGHGVGAALNVHEGPQSISTRWAVDRLDFRFSDKGVGAC